MFLPPARSVWQKGYWTQLAGSASAREFRQRLRSFWAVSGLLWRSSGGLIQTVVRAKLDFHPPVCCLSLVPLAGNELGPGLTRLRKPNCHTWGCHARYWHWHAGNYPCHTQYSLCRVATAAVSAACHHTTSSLPYLGLCGVAGRPRFRGPGLRPCGPGSPSPVFQGTHLPPSLSPGPRPRRGHFRCRSVPVESTARWPRYAPPPYPATPEGLCLALGGTPSAVPNAHAPCPGVMDVASTLPRL